MAYKKRTRRNIDIPASPMSDLAFLLIIFFLLTMVITVHTGIAFNLHSKKAKPLIIKADEVLRFHLTKDHLLLNNRVIDLRQSVETIKQSKMVPILCVDDDVLYEQFVHVIGMWKKHHIDRIYMKCAQ